MGTLTIGKLARLTGFGAATIRYYEREGLIHPLSRTEANYRLYNDDDRARLLFIRRAKALGFSLHEIRDLISLQHSPRATKADVKARTLEKIRDIRERIADLTRVLEVLEHLADSCDGHGPLSECPILDALGGNENEAADNDTGRPENSDKGGLSP